MPNFNILYFMIVPAGIIGAVSMAYLMSPTYKRKKKQKVGLQKAISFQRKYEENQCALKHNPKRQETKTPQRSSFMQPAIQAGEWNHADDIMLFFSDYIFPHYHCFKHDDVLCYGEILALLYHLDATDSSSVLHPTRDTGTNDPIFKEITLFKHSLAVAAAMVIDERMRLEKEEITNIIQTGRRVGTAMIVGLGHDIGKIPKFYDIQNGRCLDHAYISSLIMDVVIQNTTSLPKGEILAAIRNHHKQNLAPDKLTYRLMLADKQVRAGEKKKQEVNLYAMAEKFLRQQEKTSLSGKTAAETLKNPQTKKTTGGGSAGNDPLDLSWLDIDEFLAEIEPQINQEDSEGKFTAFSMPEGIVHVMPNQLADTLNQLAEKHIRAVPENKRQAQLFLKKVLAQKGIVPGLDGIKDKDPGARLILVDKNDRKKFGMFLPITATAFKADITTLEERKKNSPVISAIVKAMPERRKRKSNQENAK